MAFLKIKLSEIKSKFFWRAVFAELIATMFFVFFVTTLATRYGGKLPAPSAAAIISFGIGLAISVLVQIFGPISGAHINPVVTIGIFVVGEIGLIKTIAYTIAQFVGGIIGASFTYGLTDSAARGGLGSLTLSAGVTQAQGFFMEMLLTMLLVFTVLASTSSDHGRKDFGYSNGLAIGISVTVTHFVGITYTGAGINPARVFGPSVVINSFRSDHWVYWIGPYIGAVISALLYRFIFAKEDKDTNAGLPVTVNMNTIADRAA